MANRNLNVEELRKMYPVGTRIELLSDMYDPWHQGKRAGDKCTVQTVDDAGQIHVSWDDGGSIAIVPEVDSFRKI